jgi:hypothetical protein
MPRRHNHYMNANNDDISNRLRASLGSTEAPALGADIVSGAAERPAPRLVHPARRAAIAGGGTLAVAAIAVSALVLAQPLQQAPLFTAAGGGATSEMSASADSRLAIWTNYEYVAGDSLSTAAGEGHVYQLQRTGTADEVLRAAADALGVAGEPGRSSYFDEAYPSYVIGAEDGSAPSVVVSWSGTGDWWYNDPAAYPQLSCSSDGVCDQPAATESLAPSADEARAIAHDIFAATGFDVDAADIRVSADEWQTTASASLVVDGTQTALEWGVGWSTTGVISYAYGHSVEVVDKGSYGTVSAHDAVSRLADWRWFGAAGPQYQTGGVLYAASDLARGGDSPTPDAPDESPAVDPTEAPSEPDTSEPGTSEPGDSGTIEPAPEPTLVDPPVDPPVDPIPGPVPTPETVVVTVDEAHATLLLVWDADGNAWLVPGFAMPHPDGWFNSVISLVEGVITLPEPVAVEPLDGEIAY